jgi:ketosteroid isomerase-like protein
MKNVIISTIIILLCTCQSQQSASELKTEYEILGVLHDQVEAWNAGDLEEFMKGYWKSEDLRFISGGTIYTGWQPALDGYIERYQNKSAMGNLSFTNLEIELLTNEVALVTGKYQLNRETDDPWGLFTLIFRKTADGWRIVHDHTSAAA